MKVKWIITILLCLVGVAQADPNEAMTLWLIGSNPASENTEIEAMVGYFKNNIEYGGIADWRMYEAEDNSDLALGFYGLYHMPGLIDVNTPFDIEWLPKKLAGEPCFGLSYLFDTKGKGTRISPIAALRILDIFVLTYQFNTYQGADVKDGDKFGLSMRIRF